MRSAGIGIPAFSVSFSIDRTSAGSLSLSGSNLLNIGSITQGVTNTRKVASGTAANQKYSHQVRGFHRITAKRISATTSPSPTFSNSAFVQSQNHDPQPCIDCWYRSDSPCPQTPIGRRKTPNSKSKPGTKITACSKRLPVRRSAKSLSLATTPSLKSSHSTRMLQPTETKYSRYHAFEYATAFLYASLLNRN